MEIDIAVSLFFGFLTIIGSYLSVKSDIKADVDKGFTDVEKGFAAIDKKLSDISVGMNELKTANEKNVNELKLMSILGLVLFGAIFYVRIDAKIH
jgi:hypothetical protein